MSSFRVGSPDKKTTAPVTNEPEQELAQETSAAPEVALVDHLSDPPDGPPDKSQKATRTVSIPLIKTPDLSIMGGSKLSLGKPTDLAKRVLSGTVELKIPMNPGASLGLVSVRKHSSTNLSLTLVIENGKLVPNRCEVKFKHDDNTDTSLDGPVWWNPDRLYIEDGKIHAHVPCFIHPDITESILGPGIKEIPLDADKLIAVLSHADVSASKLPVKTQAATNAPKPTTAASNSGSATASSTPSAAVKEDKFKQPTAKAKTVAKTANSTQPALDPFDSKRLSVTFTGVLREGQIRLGKGAVINLQPGTTVALTYADKTVHAELDARVNSMQFEAKGSHLNLGPGSVRMTYDVTGPAKNKTTTVSVERFEAAKLDLEVPGKTRGHQLTVGQLRAEAKQGAPIITYRCPAKGDDSFKIALDNAELSQVEGSFELAGSNGEPGLLRITPRQGDGPIDALADVEYDSERDHFVFDGDFPDFNAETGPVELVNAAEFDLQLKSGSVHGSGRLAISGIRNPVMRLCAAPDQSVTLEAEIADAHIGKGAGSTVIADVADGKGKFQFQTLALGNVAHPVFEGSGEIAVRLDALSVPVSEDNSLTASKGVGGTLTITRMGWDENAKSPHLTAKLEVDGGPGVVLKSGLGQPSQSLRTVVDASQGKTLAEIVASLSPDGTLNASCGLTLRNISLTSGVVQSPSKKSGTAKAAVQATASAPSTAAPTSGTPSGTPSKWAHSSAIDLARKQDRQAQPYRPSGQFVAPHVVGAPVTGAIATSTNVTVPELPSVNVRPLELLGLVRNTTITLRLPTSGFEDEIVDLKYTTKKKVLGITTKTGYRVRMAAAQKPGEITGDIVVSGNTIDPKATRLRCTPPISVVIHPEASVSKLDFGTEVKAELRGLSVVQIPGTQRVRLYPEIDLKGLTGRIGEFVNLEEQIRTSLGEALSEAWIGERTLPLDTREFLAVLAKRVPSFGQEMVFDGSGFTAAPAKPSTAKPKQPPKSSSKPTSAAKAPPKKAVDPGTTTLQVNVDKLIASIALQQSTLKVKEAEFTPKTIDLGNGQSIEICKGSKLIVNGSHSNLTIEGDACLGAVNIGSKDMKVRLAGGSAHIRLQLRQGGPGSTPSFDLAITGLNADNAEVQSTVAGVTSRVFKTGIENAEVSFAQGPKGPPVFSVVAPRIHGCFEAYGNVPGTTGVGAQGQGQASTSGSIAGSLAFTNGVWATNLSHVDLLFSGVTNDGKGALRIAGKSGSMCISETGEIHVENQGDKGRLQINGDVRLPDGSHVTIDNGSFRQISVPAQLSDGVAIEGIDAEVHYNTTLKGAGTQAAQQLTQASLKL